MARITNGRTLILSDSAQDLNLIAQAGETSAILKPLDWGSLIMPGAPSGSLRVQISSRKRALLAQKVRFLSRATKSP